MRRTSRSSRWALWTAAFAVFLKAAVPLLAAAAADLRGVPVHEVCPVYGVALAPSVRPGHEHHAHHHHHGHAPGGHGEHAPDATHGGDHCALSALAAVAVPEPPVLEVPPVEAAASRVPAARTVAFRDASAAWAAGHTRGPPLIASTT